MPKELHEISQFLTGTITTPSERDIPDDAASFSTNIDPVAEAGLLQGIPDEKVMVFTNSGGGNLDVDATSMITLNNEGSIDLVSFNSTTNKFQNVLNIEANSISLQCADITSTTFSHTGPPSMEVNNKEIHIGMGNGETNKSVWVGHIKNKQFGTTYTGLQVADGALSDPSAFPDIYQFVVLNGFLYGIEWQGQHVYKFENSDTGKFIIKSQQIFTKTQGISLKASGGLWILDVVGSASSVHSIDAEEMISEFSVLVTHASRNSDIFENGVYLWVSAYSDTDSQAAVLKNVALSGLIAGASIQTLAVRTPYSGEVATPALNAQGAWLGSADHDGAGINCFFISAKTCLLDIGNTGRIGWGVVVRDNANKANTVRHRYGGTSSIAEFRTILFAVRYNASSQAKTDGTNSEIYRLGGTTDYLNNFANTMFSVTARQTDKIIISYGVPSAITSSVNSGTMVDTDSASNGDTINLSSTTTLQLSNAVVFHHDTNKISGFSGAGSGQWLRGGSISSLTQALETNVNLLFDSSDIDYGYSGNTWTAGSRTGFEESGYSYFYKVSFTYDGYQETPLSDEFKVDNDIFAGDGRPIDIKIQLKNLGSFNKRISHVNLYRAHSNSETAFSRPESFYRIVSVYELNSSFATVTGASPWSNYRQKIVRDINVAGSSYEARTGISEVLTNISPNYSLSTQLNNQLFIADVYQADLGSYTNYIYKSKPYNFDQFNYIEDFLSLPTQPTAIKAHMGRIYAFDKNTIYRIEPNSLYIEDTLEGIGCVNKKSIIANEYGMCFANDNNIYLHDGRNVQSIGDSILRGSDGWQGGRDITFPPRITFDSKTKSFLIFYKSSNDYFCWAYNITRKRWDRWDYNSTEANQPNCITTNKLGHVLIAEASTKDLVHYLGHASNKKSWTWVSKKLNMNQNTTDKSFKNLRIVGTPTGSIGDSSTSIGSGLIYAKVDDANITEVSITGLKDISLSNTRGKEIQITLSGQTSSVDAIGIIFRRHILLSKAT